MHAVVIGEPALPPETELHSTTLFDTIHKWRKNKLIILYSLFFLIWRCWFIAFAQITQLLMGEIYQGKPNNNRGSSQQNIHIRLYIDIHWQFTQGFHSLPSTVTQCKHSEKIQQAGFNQHAQQSYANSQLFPALTSLFGSALWLKWWHVWRCGIQTWHGWAPGRDPIWDQPQQVIVD